MEVSRSFFAPAIRMDGFRPDNQLIQSHYGKIFAVAIVALMASTFAVIQRPTTLNKVLVVLASILFTAATMLFIAATRLKNGSETRSAEMAIDNSLGENGFVRQYLSDEQPSNEVMRHISGNPRLTTMLIDAGADFNKFSVDGIGLVVHNMDFQAFRLLVGNGYNLRARAPGISDLSEHIHFSGFEEIVASADLRYLRFVLENRLVEVWDFFQDEQVRIWSYVGNRDAIQLLVNYGFNINAIHSNGMTAVQNLINHPKSIASCINGRGTLSVPDRADALMKFGGAKWPRGQEMMILERMLGNKKTA